MQAVSSSLPPLPPCLPPETRLVLQDSLQKIKTFIATYHEKLLKRASQSVFSEIRIHSTETKQPFALLVTTRGFFIPLSWKNENRNRLHIAWGHGKLVYRKDMAALQMPADKLTNEENISHLSKLILEEMERRVRATQQYMRDNVAELIKWMKVAQQQSIISKYGPLPVHLQQNGRFWINSRWMIGRGKFKKVFLGLDDTSKQLVSVLREKTTDIDVESRMKNEVKYLMECQSIPGIVRTYATLLLGKNSIFRMHLIQRLYFGGTLEDLISSPHQTPAAVVAFFACQILEQLMPMHAKNLCHRDVKPENILLGIGPGYFTLHLTDFAFTKKIEEKNDIICGTPMYLAPEIFRGQNCSCPMDIFALGASLYRLYLKKDLPWLSEMKDVQDFLYRNKVLALIKSLGEHTKLDPSNPSDPLMDIIKKMLAVNVSQRITAVEAYELFKAIP